MVNYRMVLLKAALFQKIKVDQKFEQQSQPLMRRDTDIFIKQKLQQFNPSKCQILNIFTNFAPFLYNFNFSFGGKMEIHIFGRPTVNRLYLLKTSSLYKEK